MTVVSVKTMKDLVQIGDNLTVVVHSDFRIDYSLMVGNQGIPFQLSCRNNFDTYQYHYTGSIEASLVSNQTVQINSNQLGRHLCVILSYQFSVFNSFIQSSGYGPCSSGCGPCSSGCVLCGIRCNRPRCDVIKDFQIDLITDNYFIIRSKIEIEAVDIM